MATSLPNFERFHIYQDNENVGTRWRKWLAKFENLVCALDITSDARKKALLLHYGGEEIYGIYESFSDEKKNALVQPQKMDQTNTMFLKGLSLTTSHRRRIRIPVMNVSSSGI